MTLLHQVQMIIVKLLSFMLIAKHFTPFLTIYQTDRPMMPFVAQDLYILVSNILKRLVKSDILHNAGSIVKIQKLDFAGEQEVKMLLEKRAISELKLNMEFLTWRRDFLLADAKKIIIKSSLKYPLTRHTYCLTFTWQRLFVSLPSNKMSKYS